MKKQAAVLLLVSVLFLQPHEKTASAGQIEQEQLISAQKSKQVLVQYKAGTDAVEKRAVQHAFPEKAAAVQSLDTRLDVLTFDHAADAKAVLSELQQDPSVEKAEENRVSYISAAPNDLYFSRQWAFSVLQVSGIWALKQEQKKSVTVAVIDSGLDMHPDLMNRIAPGGYDMYANTPEMSDPNGHGTNVAGVIAAETGNEIGIAGIAGGFDVRILPIRVANYKGEAYVSDIVEAIDYAVSQKVDIINISMGSSQSSDFEREAIERADAAGIIITASSGNSGNAENPLSYPASYEPVISVASINEYKQHSPFSTYNTLVDVTAPGESILTTGKDGTYSSVNGTSFSAPAAAGVLALLKGLNPFITPDQASQLLTQTADDLGQPGFDDKFGYGLINVQKAAAASLQMAPSSTSAWTEFAPKPAGRDKAFTISFNQPVQLEEGMVYVSKDPEGTEPVSGVTSAVQPDNAAKVTVRPDTEWAPGIYYVVVDNAVKSMGGKELKTKARMRFVVE